MDRPVTSPWSWVPAAIVRWERIMLLQGSLALFLVGIGLFLNRWSTTAALVALIGAAPEIVLVIISSQCRRQLIALRRRHLDP